MKERFSQKVAVVTGAARGIGKNIARALGREGAFVLICDSDESTGTATMNEFRKAGIKGDFLCLDLSLGDNPRKLVQNVVKNHGRLDILINNARPRLKTGLFDEALDSWELGISVMLRAPFFSSQEAIRCMSKTGGGSIVNIGSVAGYLISDESPVYHIAKAGVLHMTRYLASQAGTYGVRVNAVSPGFIVQDEHRTRYEHDDNRQYREMAEFCHPLNSVGKSDDIADAVLFLSSLEASFITGQCLVVDGGLMLEDQSNLLFRYNKKPSRNRVTMLNITAVL